MYLSTHKGVPVDRPIVFLATVRLHLVPFNGGNSGTDFPAGPAKDDVVCRHAAHRCPPLVWWHKLRLALDE